MFRKRLSPALCRTVRYQTLAGVLFALLFACSEPGKAPDTLGSDSAPDKEQSHASDRHERTDAVPEPAAQFVDVSRRAGLVEQTVSGSPEQGYIGETMSAGVATFDADADGYLDLFLVGGNRLAPPDVATSQRLYLNRQDGTFHNQTQAAGLKAVGWGMGAAVGDTDNDGDVDLYVTYLGKNKLYINNGNATFREIGVEAGVADTAWGASAALGDLDDDGLLDLYVTNYVVFDFDRPPTGPLKCNYKGLDTFCGPQGMVSSSDRLYRNRGDNSFVDLSEKTPVGDFFLPALGVVFADIDNDADLDIYVANDSERNLLFENTGSWTFRERAIESGLAYSEEGRPQAGMGVDAADFDDDGDIDIVVTNFSDDVNTLYLNDGEGLFADRTYAAGLGSIVRPYLGWSTRFFDYDNDGDLDLYVANGHIYPQLEQLSDGLRYPQQNLLYRNDQGIYTPVDGGPGWKIEKVSRGGTTFDYDNDGDLDIVINNLNDTPDLLRNDTQNENRWMGVQLVGVQSNRDGIGARVVAKTTRATRTRYVNRGRGFQAQNDPRLLFGLLPDERVDTLKVSWPSGKVHILTDLPDQTYIRIDERGNWEPLSYEAMASTHRTEEAPDGTAPYSTASTEHRRASIDQSSWNASDFARAGKELYDQGQYSAAREMLESAVRLAPQNAAIQINLAMVFFQGMGDYEKTVDVLSQTVRYAPNNSDAHTLLGKAYLSLNEIQQAKESLGRAARTDSLNWEIHNWLGLAHMRSNNAEDALSSFTHATRLAPWEPAPHLHLSRVFAELGNPAQAEVASQNFARLQPLQESVKQFREKVVLFPDSTRAHALLGLAYVEQGRKEEAARHFATAIRLDSLYAPAYHGLGKLHMLDGRVNEAIRFFERACAIDRTFDMAVFDLAQAYFRIGEFQRAIAVYTFALTIDTRHNMINTNLAMAYAMVGNLDQAKQLFYQVIERDDKSVDARDGLAQILLAEGDKQGALAQWKHILTIDPTHARARSAVRDL